MTKIKWIFTVISLVMMSWLNSANAEQALTPLKVKVGQLNYSVLPYHTVNDAGQYGGTMQAFLQDISQRANLSVEYVEFDNYSELISSLVAGDVDMVMGLYRTPSREEVMDFSQPLVIAPRGLLVSRDINDLQKDSLIKLRWVCVRGSSYCEAMDRLKVHSLVRARDDKAAIEYLESSVVDAFVGDYSTLFYLREKHEVEGFKLVSPLWLENEGMRVAVRKGFTELVTRIDNAVLAIEPDERSRYESLGGPSYEAALAFSLFKVDMASLPDYLLDDPLITYAYYGNAYPLVNVDSSERTTGVIKDTFDIISERSGITFRFIPTHSRSEVQSLYRSNKVDVIPFGDQALFPETIRIALPNMYDFEVQFIVSSDNERRAFDSGHALVGYLNDFEATSEFTKSYPNLQYQRFSSVSSLFLALDNGQIDAVQLPQLMADYYLKGHNQADYVRLRHLAHRKQAHLLVAKSSPNIARILDRLVKIVSASDIEKIKNHYVLSEERAAEKRLVRYISILALALALVIILVVFWHFAVRSEVRKRRAAEQKAVNKFNFVQQLIDAIPTMIVYQDKEFKRVMWNKAYKEGYKRYWDDKNEFLLSNNPYGIEHIEENEKVWRTGETITKQTVAPNNNDQMRHLVYTKSIERDADGNPEGLLTVVTDITEVIELKEQAGAAQRLLKSITDAMPGGVWQFSHDVGQRGYFGYLSKGALSLLGINESTSDAIDLNSIKTPDTDVMQSAIADAVANQSAIDITFRVESDHGLRWCRLIGQLEKTTSDADSLNWNGLVLDVTDFKNNESALQEATAIAHQAVKARGDFLATMSHELRTPIAGIAGLLELIKESNLNQEQRFLVSNVDTSLNNLLFLVNDILDFSKIEAGQLTLEYRHIVLDEVLCNVFRVHGASILSKGVRLNLNWHTDQVHSCTVDGLRLSQIVSNLMSNAVKFTDEGSIDIDVAAHNSLLKLTITDSGIGMSEEHLQSLFQPFKQGDNSVARRFGGTGLGMTITQQLLEAMGGRISVKSKLNQGTEVTIEVPISNTQALSGDTKTHWFVCTGAQHCTNYLDSWQVPHEVISLSRCADKLADGALCIVHQAHLHQLFGQQWQECLAEYKATVVVLTDQASAFERLSKRIIQVGNTPLYPDALRQAMFFAADELPPMNASQFSQQAGRINAHILVVEDNEVNQLLLSRQLDKLGATYTLADNGVEAIDVWQNEHFDLVLTDCHMPFKDGYQLAKELRGSEFNTKVPIVGVTADDSKEAAHMALNSGMNEVLIKPYTLEQLFDKLSQYLTKEYLTKEHSAPSIQSEKDEQNLASQSTLALWRDVFADENEAKTMAQIFSQSIGKDLTLIEQGVEANDPELLQKKLHSMKGALGMLGLNEFAAQVKEAEVKVKEQGAEEAKVMISDLASKLRDTISDLEQAYDLK